MEKKFKISDIAKILGVTPKTVYRMIDRNELRTCQDTYNNRKITCILITDNELSAHLEKNKKYEPSNTVNNVDCEEILTDNDNTKTRQDVEIIDKIKELIIEVNEHHNDTVKEYIDRIITAEKQVLLLTDSEKNKESEYLRQVAELKAENEKLKQQLHTHNIPFFNWFKRQ